ncbi:ATP-dependent zinc metalloprotease FtsH [Propioniferax innocua]|uniref:ATP-dependent zinc metalloprotease FtsH n=1 Tax=Propioniferax innocua TaxID=1753 RepID=A0A542ZCX7_9ACTN|nr:membrane protease FtsH catalytic subunit [Propioniferax innocua]
MKLSKIFRSPFFWIILGLLGLIIVMDFARGADGYEEIPTSEAVSRLESKEPIKSVTLVDNEQLIRIEMPDETKYKAYWVGAQGQELTSALQTRVTENTLEEWSVEVPQPSFWSFILPTLIPFLLIGLLFFWLISSVQGGGSRVMQFGKSKAKAMSKDSPKTTFGDVAGCEEALEELEEIKEFLSEPAKFQAVGAKIPKGVLLYGPPGTGKTLLARAVAGEAGVPFYSISGSDFVEMFVGVGASRVRDLFEQAKENAPAIVFIDEIDAVGRHRGAGMGGGHDEREQTLNQLLVEMDGFDVRGGVILIAATNRPDVLDPALLRPGRFDRQIGVEAPDVKGRLQILKVHAQGKPMGGDVDLASIARRTPGFTGADLANVLNEAALLTARANQNLITAAFLDEAVDRVIAGPQKSSRLMNHHELLTTAYHEGGHALVAAAMPKTDPVQKITILPRGRALGYTMVMPDDDKYSHSRGELLDQLAYMLGGRAAEEMVFHDPTTGASNDIEKATGVARAMVTQYGMSDRVGAIRLGKGDSEPFLGMEMGGGHTRDYSESVAAVVDEEVKYLIANAHQEAYEVLEANRDILDELVRQLFEKETLNRDEVDHIFAGLRRFPDRGAWTGSDRRVPSQIPPVDVPERPAQDPDAPRATPADPTTPVLPGPTPDGSHPPYPGGSR